jgi:hypothetical protein
MSDRTLRRFMALVCAALFSHGTPSLAAAAHPPAVFGPGAGSCGTWTAGHQSYTALTAGLDAWLLGYLSGYSWWGTKGSDAVFGNTENGAFIGWVSNYCGAHPATTVVQAANALIQDLNRHAHAAH